MNKILCGLLLSGSLVGAAQASGFEGFYVGAKAGYNDSSAFGQTKKSWFGGGEAGYNWVVSWNMVAGLDLWGDGHQKSVTGRDYGADFRLGNVNDAMMYYVKLGVAATHPGTRVHYGLGVEYKFDHHWGGLAEWTGDSMSKDATTYTNNNLVVGATFHF